jgi:hypothetical protein
LSGGLGEKRTSGTQGQRESPRVSDLVSFGPDGCAYWAVQIQLSPAKSRLI